MSDIENKPDSRSEKYLHNILSVLNSESLSETLGIPQSRVEEYLSKILNKLQESSDPSKSSYASKNEANIFSKENTFKNYVVVDDGFSIHFIRPSTVTSGIKDILLDYKGITFTKPDGSTSFVGWEAIPNMNLETGNSFKNLTVANKLTAGSIPGFATSKDLETKMPNPPSTEGTYTYKATRTSSGVTFEWVLD